MPSRRTNASSFGLALVLAMAITRPAFADPDSSARAQALFDEGVKLLEHGEWAGACAKLSESHALDPAGGTALDIGFCEENRGYLASALVAYEDALRRAIEDGRPEREQLARRKLDELASRTSRVRVRLGPAVARLPGLAVAIDGATVSADAIGSAIPVDPGKRTVTVRATGKRSVAREVWVSGQAILADVDVAALDDEDASPAVSAPSAAPRPPANDAAASEVAASEAAARRRTLGLALGGGGVAFVAVGIVAGIAASEAHAESDRECPGGACSQDGVEAEDRALRLAWVSNGGLAVGGLLVAVGTYVFLTAPKAGPARSVRMAPRGFSISF